MYSICCFQLIPPPLRIELVHRLFIFNSYWDNYGLFIDDLIRCLSEILTRRKWWFFFFFFFFYMYMGGLFWTFSSSYQYRYVYMYSICCFQLIPPPLRIELIHRLFIFNSYWDNRGLFVDDLIRCLSEVVLEESFDKKEVVIFLFFFYIYLYERIILNFLVKLSVQVCIYI